MSRLLLTMFLWALLAPAMAGQGTIAFYAERLWQDYDFREQIPREKFLEFSFLLSRLPEQDAEKYMDDFVKRAAIDDDHAGWALFLMESYIYHPESRFHNERLFRSAIKSMMSCESLSEAFRAARQYQWESLSRCMEGEQAADIRITMASGLSVLVSEMRSPYLLLLFYNPDCDRCHRLVKQIQDSRIIDSLIQGGSLRILAIYPLIPDNGQNWRLADLPPGWINGYDSEQAVYLQRLYTLREIPSMYLLNEDGILLLKERSYEDLERFLVTLLPHLSEQPIAGRAT